MLAASSPPPVLRGAQLYDALYATGYHSSLNTTRAQEALQTLHSHAAAFGVRSVLDVGCSHGFAVQQLWSMGFIASGVDVSALAVAKAKRARGEPEGRCILPCFVRGSATQIPWPSGAFDAILSTDALEHVEKNDTIPAVIELSRVAGKMLVLKIAQRGDMVSAGQHHAWAQRQHQLVQTSSDPTALPSGVLPRDLHPSTHGPMWWVERFEKLGGWQLHSVLPTPAHRPWMCCGFTLVRWDATRTRRAPGSRIWDRCNPLCPEFVI